MAVAFGAITETAADALDIDRVSVWLFDHERTKITCEDLFERTTQAHSRGIELFAKDFPAYFDALQTEEVISAQNAHQDPRTSCFSGSYLTPLGIGAMLDAPIRVAGSVRGVICHEHVGGEREFAIDEQNAASYLASLGSLALEFQRRVRMDRELAQSLSLLRATLEATGEAILAVDSNGSVLTHNQRFVDLWKIPAELLGPAGDRGPRLEFLAQQTTDPVGFIARARDLFHDRERESIDTVELVDGRRIERTGRPQWLDGQVIGRVWSYRDVTHLKRIEETLRASEALQREIANRDGLTGLANRRHILEKLDEEIARADRSGRPFSVAMLDLDHFKLINDEHGHLVGDDVLRELAKDLNDRLRKTDRAGRYGGEEFLLILPDTPKDGAHRVLAELRMHISRPRQPLPHFTASAGVAEYPRDGVTLTALIETADLRLYQAKHGGRNRVR